MKVNNILGIVLRFVTIIYTLFALIYGFLISAIDLTKTINFEGDSLAIVAARQKQLLIGFPYIILGVVLLVLLILFYMSYKSKVKITKMLGYSFTVVVVGAFLTLGYIAIAIHINETSLILCIIPAALLFIYGIFSIIMHKKDKKELI